MTDVRIAPETYRLLVEESLLGVYLVQDERLVYANRKLAELFGYSRDEILQVPSVLVPESANFLFNPSHADAGKAQIVRNYDWPFDTRFVKNI